MSLSALLDRSLTYQRQTIAPDGSGGAVRSFATLLVGVPCAISPASAAVATDYARRDMIVDYSIFTTADLDSLLAGGPMLGDRLVDGSVVYLVKTVKKSANAAVSNQPLYKIDCQRIVDKSAAISRVAASLLADLSLDQAFRNGDRSAGKPAATRNARRTPLWRIT